MLIKTLDAISKFFKKLLCNLFTLLHRLASRQHHLLSGFSHHPMYPKAFNKGLVQDSKIYTEIESVG